MAYFKPDPDSLIDLDYSPRFYCQLCGADMFAVQISERKVDGGVLRELECPNCHCVERVGIRLSEDFSGWILFQAEEPSLASGTESIDSSDQES